MTKKTILIILIAITAAVTYYLYEEPLPNEKRAAVAADLAAQPQKSPSTPGRWSDGGLRALGM